LRPADELRRMIAEVNLSGENMIVLRTAADRLDELDAPFERGIRPVFVERQIQVGWTMLCTHCERRFESKRKDAKVCSTRCRNRSRNSGQ